MSIEPLESRIAPAFASQYHLADLNGDNGFRIDGKSPRSGLGSAVGAVGDINGDGFGDYLIGAIGQYGAAYVIFGKAHGFSKNFSLSKLNGSNGFRLAGEAQSALTGSSVASAGDLNNDGFDDIIIGAPSINDLPGTAYVIFGKAEHFKPKIELSKLNGSNGFKVSGLNPGDQTGISVDGAGDVNGDGFDDVIVGAPYADLSGKNSGAAYVVYGRANGFEPEIDVSSLDGKNGFTIAAALGYDRAGSAVSSAGDVNGDGIDDIIVGALRVDPDGNEGGAYVIFGRSNGFEPVLDLGEIDEAEGFSLIAVQAYNQTGASVSSAGDVNGDGFGDVVVGAELAGYGYGAAYIVFGGNNLSSLNLAALNGENGFSVSRMDVATYVGRSVASAGDVNGDGYGDVLVGANFSVHVILGKPDGFDAALSLTDLDGTNGFRITGKGDDLVEARVSSGDINGDGLSDLFIGEPNARTKTGLTGSAYIVFGGDPGRLWISGNGKTATYTDPEGDLISLRTNRGKFSESIFDFRPEGAGFQLEKLDLTASGFDRAAIEFTAQRQDWNKDGMKDGDGKVNIGYLNATGLDLRSVSIAGDLGQIDCGDGNVLKPALKSLTIQSLGSLGTTTQDSDAAPNLHSDLTGDVKTLTVAMGITGGVTFAVAGNIGSVTIGGDLDGSTITALGTLLPLTAANAVAIQSISIGGNINASQILAGYDLAGAAMNADASIGKVIVQKNWSASDLVAGIADSPTDGFGRNDTLIPGGSDSIIAQIASITIKGTATGSTAENDHFAFTSQSIGTLKISKIPVPLNPSVPDNILLDQSNDDFRLLEPA